MQVSDPSGGAMFVADPKKPVGGHVLAHASTIRISLRKGKAEQRVMKVVDAPNLRECHARLIPCLVRLAAYIRASLRALRLDLDACIQGMGLHVLAAGHDPEVVLPCSRGGGLLPAVERGRH